MKPEPFEQFQDWFAEAQAAALPAPEAMTLATATSDGRPSARIVLFKGLDAGGLLFFTNLRSRKARELEENPRGALVFHWEPLRRQVRIEGRVERLSWEASDRYFRTRPRDSQLSAWASPQSEVIASREELERRVAELAAEHAGREIPCPPFWGGYRLVPDQFEFWIGRESRLHDRFRYTREAGGWKLERLAP